MKVKRCHPSGMLVPDEEQPSRQVDALLDCPFCGSEAEIEPWHGGALTKHMVACSDSLCPVSPMTTGETRDEAISRWNTRAI